MNVLNVICSFSSYRSSASRYDNPPYEHSWLAEPVSASTTRAIVERRPITPSDDESSFA